MSTPVSDSSVAQVFARLAQAVESGDLALYRTVARDPNDAFQMQLFERNSAMIKKDRMRLAFLSADVRDTDATVHFAVHAPTGEQVEQGEMTFVRHHDAWVVAEL